MEEFYRMVSGSDEMDLLRSAESVNMPNIFRKSIADRGFGQKDIIVEVPDNIPCGWYDSNMDRQYKDGIKRKYWSVKLRHIERAHLEEVDLC